MNRNKELARNTVIFGIGTIGAKLMQFILVPLYTVYLTTSDYSAADLITSTVTLMTPFLTLGMAHGIMRFVLANRKTGTQLLRLSTLISLFSTAFLFAIVPLFKLLGIYEGRELLIPLLFLTGSLKSNYAAYCKAIERNTIYAIDGIISAAITAILSWVFLSPLHMGIDGYLYAIFIANVLSIILFLCTCPIIKTIFTKTENETSILRPVLRYTLPLMPNELSWWIIQMSDRYILRFIGGAVINGIYTMAYKIPGIFNIVVSIFISAFTITAYKECDINATSGKYDGSYFGEVFRKYTAITFICASLVILATQPVAYLFIKKDFYQSWKYTPFIMISFAIGNLESYFGTLLSGMNKPKYCFYSTSAGAIVNIILDIMLIKIFSAYGAIAATIIGYFVVYMVRVFGVKKHMDIELNVSKAIASLLLLLVMAFCYCRESIVVRLLSLVIFGLIITLYWVEVKSIISTVYEKSKKILKR